MASNTPRARLKKLFGQTTATSSNNNNNNIINKQHLSSPVSPVSPSSPSNNQNHVRKSSSRLSLHNVFHGKGSPSSAHSRKQSLDTASPDARAAARAAAANAAHSDAAVQPLPNLPPPPARELSNDLQHLTLAGGSAENHVVGDASSRLSTSHSQNAASALSPSVSLEARTISRKGSLSNLRTSVDTPSRGPTTSLKDTAVQSNITPKSSAVSRAKDLPRTPSDVFAAELENDQLGKHDSGVESALGKERGYLVKDSSNPVDLKGIVDLEDSETTHLHKTWAPAVTHETIKKDVHEIREERITREVHNHHVFHRILPIIDIEVLPARHFIPIEGGYAEIAEEEVPGQAGKNAQWMIAETVSKMMPRSNGPLIPQRFSARKFEADEGQYKEYMTPEGHMRTETTWVHPPTIETGGMESGQTYPFYFNSPNPANDGLRARLPAGSVIGVSALFAKQQKERLEAQQSIRSAVTAASAGPGP